MTVLLIHKELNANVIPLSPYAEKAQAAIDVLPTPEGLYRSIPTHLLNRFGQQRGGENEVQVELDKSIETLGVLEPILVSVMTADELAAYIDFTNKTWDGTARLEDCVPFAATDTDNPLYLALVGGHSRVSAIEQIAIANDLPLDNNIRVDARIIPVNSAVDYAVKQAAENIHSRPSPYRTIRLVASAYLFKINQGEKFSRRSFAEEMSISEQTLRDALNYADLPAKVRNYTDKGLLPIGVSIELARALPAIRRECAWRVNRDTGSEAPTEWTPDAIRTYEELVDLELFRHITAHNNKRTNNGRILITRTQIRMHAKNIRRKLGERDAPEGTDLEMNLFDARDFEAMDTSTRTVALRKAIEDNLREFASDRQVVACRLHNLVCSNLGFENLGVNEPKQDESFSLGTAALTLVSS